MPFLEELQDDEERNNALIGLVVCVVIGYVCNRLCCGCSCRSCCCCCCCCFRRKQQQQLDGVDKVEVAGTLVEAGHLQERKAISHAYLLWLSCGLVGAHHFYLNRVVHGVCAALSLNFFTLGWLVDSATIPLYVAGYNAKTSAYAPQAHRGRGLITQSFLVFAAFCIGVLSFFAYIIKAPSAFELVTRYDIAMELAGTDGNPYDILEVSRGTNVEEILQTLRARKDKKPQDARCDSECKKQRSKALTYFKKIKERKEADRKKRSADEDKQDDDTFTRYDADDTAEEWKAMFRIIGRVAGQRLQQMNITSTSDLMDEISKGFERFRGKEREGEERTDL